MAIVYTDIKKIDYNQILAIIKYTPTLFNLLSDDR